MNDQITILHVDDDEDIRAITELSLNLGPGFVLHQCASGPEALKMAPEINPDVFLLDMMMPEMNGEETWERLKNDVGMHDIPTIFMSARAEEEFAKHLVEIGAAGIITKPFDPMTLGQEIRDTLIARAKDHADDQTDSSDNVLKFGT